MNVAGEPTEIAPSARAFRRRSWGWMALIAIAIVAPVVLAREASRAEAALTLAGKSSERVVAQEVEVGQTIHVPLYDASEIVRVVVYAVGPHVRGQPRGARIDASIRGREAQRDESIMLALPATNDRVVAEDLDVVVGDPAGASIDVAGIGAGDVSLSLASVTGGGRSLLMRVFRRDAIDERERERRARHLGDAQLRKLASRSWELAWVDLSDAERDDLLASRWLSVSVVGSRASRALVVSKAPAPPRQVPWPIVSRASLLPSEAIAVVAKREGGLTIDTDPAVHIEATIRGLDGSSRAVEGDAELVVDAIPAGASVLVESAAPARVTVRAKDRSAFDDGATVTAWRIAHGRPAVVAAGAAPIVVRISARVPMPRGGPQTAMLSLTASVSGASPKKIDVPVTRSTVDRYEGIGPALGPSEPKTFYVVVPALGAATIESDAEVDLVFAELAPDPPRVPLGHSTGAPARLRMRGTAGSGAFVPRRPSNAHEMTKEPLHIARSVEPVTVRELPRTVKIRRPRHLASNAEGNETFVEGSEVVLEVMTPGRPLSVPVRVKATQPIAVTVRALDGPLRRTPGVYERVTLEREIAAGDSRAVFVLGEDLAPGQKLVELRSSAPFSLHVPWEQEGTPRWAEGDFEP